MFRLNGEFVELFECVYGEKSYFPRLQDGYIIRLLLQYLHRTLECLTVRFLARLEPSCILLSQT